MESLEKKPLLCIILEAEGVLSVEKAKQALNVWRDRRRRDRRCSFGQVVLALGMVDSGAMVSYLAMQRKLAGAPGQAPLGIMLLEAGVIKPSLLLKAMEKQAAAGKRLGEILLQEGLVRRIQIDMLLNVQKRARTKPLAA